MKKLVIWAMVAAMSFTMVACGNNSTTSIEKENTEQTADTELVLNTEQSAAGDEEQTDTTGEILAKEFQDRISENPNISTQELAEALIGNSIIPFQGAAMSVEPGFLAGFDNEIIGFKEGAMFGPVISTIPFVGYIFTLEEGVDVEAFIATLNENANLAWNICTMAEEKTVVDSGNTVFFLMSNKNLGE